MYQRVASIVAPCSFTSPSLRARVICFLLFAFIFRFPTLRVSLIHVILTLTNLFLLRSWCFHRVKMMLSKLSATSIEMLLGFMDL